MYKPDFLIVRQSFRNNGPGRPKGDGSSKSVYYWPDFDYMKSRDLMVQGKSFYAIWDEENGIWSRDVYRAVEIIDDAVDARVAELFPDGDYPSVEHLRDDSTGRMYKFLEYIKRMGDNFKPLDMTVTFQEESRPREDYVSKRLPYSLEPGSPDSYLHMMTTLYSPAEMQKLEWAVGAILAGDSSKIQKFIVLYGDSGTGKSTFLRILAGLFRGYRTTFTAADMSTKRDAFAMEMFQDNPLVAIDDDGDLSKIEDNSLLNRVVSHEEVPVNAKFKSKFNMRPAAMLFVGTNRKVKITERKSGLLRRLIDVEPTGNLVEKSEYDMLMHRILNFELGKIANRCLTMYRSLGPNAYDSYKAITMISGTNRIFNFIVDYRDKFTDPDAKFLTREEMWTWYKQWCSESGEFPIKRIEFGEEMMSYFERYQARLHVDDKWIRNAYIGFKDELVPLDWSEGRGADTFIAPVKEKALELNETESVFDSWYADAQAQYWMDDDPPLHPWSKVETTLSDLDTSKTHAVRVEPNHIVIDFDMKDAEGNKSKERNLVAAAKWPDTYAELSQSGGGVHLHYFYDGDPEKLAPSYSDDIEIKVFKGKMSLRRRVTSCNALQMATLSVNMLPKKGDKKKMVDLDGFKNEKVLRSQITKCLRKEVHPNTIQNVQFIAKLLDEAQASGEFYDVEDLHADVISFAQRSTNQSSRCLALVSQMKFSSKPDEPAEDSYPLVDRNADGRTVIPNEELTFFDIEIFKNVFMICYKPYDGPVMKLLNPSATEVKELFGMNLVGFNNRHYDNHIIWAAGMLNYNTHQLYELSQKIIKGDGSSDKFPQAYGLSYTDVWDFNSNKQGLKKWEIDLGITHIENSYDWDEPLPENAWFEVLDYCANDVIATEAVFKHCHDDYTARCILASLAGSVPNQSTRNLVKKVIFGDLKDTRSQLEYTDLSEMFPGYKYEAGVSTYRGFEVGEGGFVYAVPGIYQDVVTFDVASMHPASLIALNYFGKYTKVYAEMREARVAIKHGDFDKASKLLDGKLAPFLEDESIDPKALANALKLVLNSTYGYTKMTSVLDFVHPKNKDNIIAKRGALFMIDVLKAVEEAGGEVIHIKTDSIKVVNPTNEVTELIYSMGEKYGYEFEVESEYDRIALVNDAVYIAHDGEGWEATGKQFAEPYVYKTLFSGEDVIFDDLCQTKSVKDAKMYINISKDEEPSYRFVGSVGRFTPMDPTVIGAGPLMVYRNEKYSAVTGTKGYSWMQSEFVRDNHEEFIDMSYFDELAQKAKDKISEFGDFEKFVKGEL